MKSTDKSKWCVVFDVDDSLYLECNYVESGFRAVDKWITRRLGVRGFGERCWSLFLEGCRKNTFDRVIGEYGISADETLVPNLVRVYRCHTPNLDVPPDTTDCLSYFCSRTSIGIITDGHPDSQRRKVSALGLNGLADVVALTGTWGESYSKPHVRAFQYVENTLKSRSTHFVYVADNPLKDFRAPRTLGWTTVRIRRDKGLYSHFDNLLSEEPDAEITDLRALPDCLVDVT